MFFVECEELYLASWIIFTIILSFLTNLEFYFMSLLIGRYISTDFEKR